MNNNLLKTLIKFFFFGMAFQFIAHTIVVYGLKVPDSGIRGAIWAWKELLILGLGLRSCIILQKQGHLKNLLHNKAIITILGFVTLSFIVSLLNSLIIHSQSIVTFLISAKFTYFPLIIGCIGILIGYVLTTEEKQEIFKSIIQSIKIVLLFSLGRYFLLHTFSNGLDRIGYAQPGSSIEWTANTPPPSLWLTEFYTGYVRNQGPFGGPLSLGFYLACLWPFFFIQVLYKKKFSDNRGRRLLYISMTISTFSRASRVMFIVINGCISLVIYRKYASHIILGGLALILSLGSYLYLGGKSELFLRAWSDSGHKEYLTEGGQMIQKNWLRGMGASTVGPASYHNPGEKAFNPENQYIQVRLEYGILGAILRFLSYILLFKNSLLHYRQLWTKRKPLSIESLESTIPILGLAGLSIANIVLHPMTDSSSMYPFMMISGLLLSKSLYNEKNDNTIDYTLLIKTTAIIKKGFWTNFRTTLRIMTIVWGLFFIIQTFLVSTLHIFSNTITISIIRDSLFAGAVIITMILHHNHLLQFIKENRVILSIILGLFILPILHTGLLHTMSMFSFIAGIKFDIHYLFILALSLRLGSLIAYEKQKQELVSYLHRLAKFAICLIGGGIIRQLAKNVRPDFFVHYIGMSLPRDFIPFNNPPIYYITGPGGIQRLSGFLVGPNTLGFFLIAFFGFLWNEIKLYSNKKLYYGIIALLLISTIATLSRGALLGVAGEIIIMLFTGHLLETSKFKLTLLKKSIITISILFITIGIAIGINHRKVSSNSERKASLNSAVTLIYKQPLLGYGPGFVGPGKHYDSGYLNNKKNDNAMVENIYLQILINEGIVGFLLRCSIWFYVFYHHRLFNKSNIKDETATQYFHTLGIGLAGLLSIGGFLHVFIDSIVNYLFRISYGILLGYNTHQHIIKKTT